MSDDNEIPLIILVIIFYVIGLVIAFYIRIRKVYLIRQIKQTGRVISLSSTIISILMQQIQQQQRQQQISPTTGLPAPPPYTIEAHVPSNNNNNNNNVAGVSAPPASMVSANIGFELPPPYMAPPPYSSVK